MIRSAAIRQSAWTRACVFAAAAGFAAVALAASGNLDASYGTSGAAISLGQVGAAKNVAVQSDGRALIGGNRQTSSGSTSWRIERFDTTGSIDGAYGSGGAATLFGNGSGEFLSDLRVDASDRCVAIGMSNVSSHNKLTLKPTVVRMTASGALDSTFGSGGVANPPVAVDVVAFQPDGKILLAGTGFAAAKKGATDYFPIVVRLTSSGALDSTFGTGGVAEGQRTRSTMGIRSVAVQSSGHIVVGGNTSSSPNDPDWYVARFLPSGAVDTSFAPATSPAGAGYLFGLSVDRFDRIVASGDRVNADASYDAVVARFVSAGSVDTSFGVGGCCIVTASVDTAFYGSPVFQSDDKVVLAMIGDDASYSAAVRVLDDGQPDSAYGIGGIGEALTLAGVDGTTWAWDIALTPSGDVVIGGWAGQAGVVSQRWFVAKYLAN